MGPGLTLAVSLAALAAGVLALLLAAARVRRGRPARAGGADRRRKKWSSAGGLVLDGRGRIALCRQRDRKGRWRWTLPKGRIDQGESAAQAALREVHEESGLRARIVAPVGVHEGRLNFVYYFEMVIEQDDGVHDRETREVRLVPLAEAAELLRSRRDLRVLRRFLETRLGVAAGPPAAH